MRLLLLLISTWIDWFSVEQLEDFKHEQNVNGSNGLFPLFSTAACFFLPTLTSMVRVVPRAKVEDVLSRTFLVCQTLSLCHANWRQRKLNGMVNCKCVINEALDLT